MADSQTPSGTDVYNAGYNQPNDSQIIATGYYDPPPAYDGQLQSLAQSQNFRYEPERVTQPLNSGQPLQNNRELPPDFDQLPTYEQQPPHYEQQPPGHEQQSTKYGQQPPACRQHPRDFLNVDYCQEQQQSFIIVEQHTIVAQPLQRTITVNGTRRSDQTVIACLVCLFCFCPTGIIALIFAIKTNSAYKAGNFSTGSRYHIITRIFIVISVILGIVGFVLLARKYWPIHHTPM